MHAKLSLAILILASCGTKSNGLPDSGGPPVDAGIEPEQDGGPELPGDDGSTGPEDSDKDGLTDDEEGRATKRDTDGDGVPDYLDLDSDNDCMSDKLESREDWDGDKIPNWIDSRNNGPAPTVLFKGISTTFNSPIGIDYHEPTNTVVMSVNYPSGSPYNFERIDTKGNHVPLSTFNGMTDEVKIATVRSGNVGGFVTGTSFTGNGVDGQIVRIAASGSSYDNPWLTLPGSNNGLMRGSLYVDRTGVFGGDLIVATTTGMVYRVTSAKVATKITDLQTHLEGLIVVPNCPVRYGPLAGQIIIGAEDQGLLYAIDKTNKVTNYTLGVSVEDIDLAMPFENFFGVNFGSSKLLGASYKDLLPMAGDILLTQELNAIPGEPNLYRLAWDGKTLKAEVLKAATGSATIDQWEHVTTAGAGINEVPPPPPPPN